MSSRAKRGHFQLKLNYKIEEHSDNEYVYIQFDKENKLHLWHSILDKCYINRSAYDPDHTLTSTQQRELTKLSPSDSVQISLLTDKQQQQAFIKIVCQHMNTNNLFAQFNTASIYGAITCAHPYSSANLIEVGRTFTRLQLWAHDNSLAFQPVGCYMVGIFDKHHETHHGGAAIIETIFSNSKNFEPAIGFRIGIPKEHSLPNQRKPADEVIAWHIE